MLELGMWFQFLPPVIPSVPMVFSAKNNNGSMLKVDYKVISIPNLSFVSCSESSEAAMSHLIKSDGSISILYHRGVLLPRMVGSIFYWFVMHVLIVVVLVSFHLWFSHSFCRDLDHDTRDTLTKHLFENRPFLGCN
jgi:hypothetical protein